MIPKFGSQIVDATSQMSYYGEQTCDQTRHKYLHTLKLNLFKPRKHLGVNNRNTTKGVK